MILYPLLAAGLVLLSLLVFPPVGVDGVATPQPEVGRGDAGLSRGPEGRRRGCRRRSGPRNTCGRSGPPEPHIPCQAHQGQGGPHIMTWLEWVLFALMFVGAAIWIWLRLGELVPPLKDARDNEAAPAEADDSDRPSNPARRSRRPQGLTLAQVVARTKFVDLDDLTAAHRAASHRAVVDEEPDGLVEDDADIDDDEPMTPGYPYEEPAVSDVQAPFHIAPGEVKDEPAAFEAFATVGQVPSWEDSGRWRTWETGTWAALPGYVEKPAAPEGASAEDRDWYAEVSA